MVLPPGPGLIKPSPLPAVLPANAPTEQEILEGMMDPQRKMARAPPSPLPPSSAITPALAQVTPKNRDVLQIVLTSRPVF